MIDAKKRSMVISDGAQSGRALLWLSVFEEQVKRVDMQALRYGKTRGGAQTGEPGTSSHAVE